MTRTYLLHIRLSIAVSAAQQGLALTDYDDFGTEPLWPVNSDSMLLSTVGDAILMTHTSPLNPAEVLKLVLDRFSPLPIEDAAVLEIGARCRASDEGDDDEDDDDAGWSRYYSLGEWMADGRLLYDSRSTHGRKALIFTTEHRQPVDLQSVRQLRRLLPEATPHWHGRNSLMLALATDGDVDRLWTHHAVQRLVDDPEVSFAACFEIGPDEATLHGLDLVLPGCQRRRKAPVPGRSEGATRTVTVEYARKRGWVKAPSLRQAESRTALPTAALRRFDPAAFQAQTGDCKLPPAANDALPEANDNRRVSEIKVSSQLRRARRGHKVED